MTTPGTTTQLAADLRLAVGRLNRRLRLHSGSGLTPSQSSIIATLASAGPIRLGELARREAVSAPTASKAVERLIEIGMIEQTSDSNDARIHILALTAQGRKAAQRSDDAATRLLTEALAKRSHDEHRTLRQALPVLQAIIEDLHA